MSEHLKFLQIALDEANKCVPVPTAFCVGCVLVFRPPTNPESPVLLATGYSRELPGNTHAEANALAKFESMSDEAFAQAIGSFDQSKKAVLAEADIYTTMEPCSIRTSGLSPCANALIAAGVKRCFIGVGEPDDFVNCEGAQRLKKAGIEVIWLDGLQDECLAVARKGH